MTDAGTIIISMPYRGYSDFVARAVESFLVQTYPDFILVVAGDADDSHREALAHIDDPRLVVHVPEPLLPQDQEQTLPRGRFFWDRAILEAARYVDDRNIRLFSIADADDWVSNDRFERLMRFHDHRTSRVVFSSVVNVMSSGRQNIRQGRVYVPHQFQHWASHCALYSIDVLDPIAPHPEFKHGWDTFLVSWLMRYYPYYIDQKPTLYVDLHAPSESRGSETAIGTPYRKSLRSVLERLWEWQAIPGIEGGTYSALEHQRNMLANEIMRAYTNSKRARRGLA